MTDPTFPSLGVSQDVSDVLAKRGIITAFPIQTMVMADALAGRDVLARSRTGSGKTLAFAIPIVERLGCIRAEAVRPDPGADPRAGLAGRGRVP